MVVNIGGIVATGQTFSAVTQLEGNTLGSFDGILGLAFPSLSNLKQVNFIYIIHIWAAAYINLATLLQHCF